MQARRNEQKSGGYHVWNIVGHHDWPTKKIFDIKSSKIAEKT